MKTEAPEVEGIEEIGLDIMAPADLQPGTTIIHKERILTITKIEHIKEPWTGRSAIAATIDSTTKLVFLVLLCATCNARIAAPYSMRQSELEWLELRWKGEVHWICPACVWSLRAQTLTLDFL